MTTWYRARLGLPSEPEPVTVLRESKKFLVISGFTLSDKPREQRVAKESSWTNYFPTRKAACDWNLSKLRSLVNRAEYDLKARKEELAEMQAIAATVKP